MKGLYKNQLLLYLLGLYKVTRVDSTKVMVWLEILKYIPRAMENVVHVNQLT